MARAPYKYDPKNTLNKYINNLKYYYGLTYDRYLEISNEQQGRCKICGYKPNHRLHVDHCHETGKIRGLICFNCNRGLGCFKDNLELLQKAKDYLNGEGINV